MKSRKYSRRLALSLNSMYLYKVARRVAGKAIVVVLSAIGLTFKLVPKKPGLCIFSQSRGRYSGNSRALFESQPFAQEWYWLYESIDVVTCAPDTLKHLFVKRASFRGFVLCMRAESVLISHSSGDFGLLWHLIKYSNVVMLWHAIGIKSAGLLDRKFSVGRQMAFLGQETKYYSKMICSSQVDRFYTSSYQGIDVRKVHVTGLPKADRYLLHRKEKRPDGARMRWILYAPTFRDWDQSSSLWFPFAGDKLAELQVILQGCPDVKFSLRPHPNDKESTKDAISLEEEFPGRFELLSVDILDDIDERLAEFDAIITDYSSIYMEPLLADVPVIFIAHDIERYESERGLAYPYDLVTPGPKVRGWKELEDAIYSAVDGAPEYKEQRKFVRDMFFKYQDCNSCERICALLWCNGKNPTKRCTP